MSTKKDISIETGNEQLTKAEETSDGVPVSPPVMVYVVAPAALPAGYKFEAQVQGFIDKTFPVVVVSIVQRKNAEINSLHNLVLT